MIYVIMFTFSTFFAYLASHSKDRGSRYFFSVICILLPCIIGGIRQVGVGFDTRVYALPHYSAAARAASFIDFLAADIRLYKEISWALLTYVSAKVFHSINWSFFFHQLITLTCIYAALYKHRKIVSLPFAWLIFFLVMHGPTYNFIRQSIAASIIFLGFNNLEERRYGRFLLYIIAGASFHTSAVIVVSYFIVFHIFTTCETSNTRIHHILLNLSLAAVIAVRPIMGFIIRLFPLFSAYQGFENAVGKSILEGSAIAGLELGELLIFTIYSKGMRRVFAKGNMYKFYRYNLWFQVIYRLFVRVFAYRILYFFDMVNIILLASLPSCIREKTLRILVSVFVFITAVMFYVAVFVIKNGHRTFPYIAIIEL